MLLHPKRFVMVLIPLSVTHSLDSNLSSAVKAAFNRLESSKSTHCDLLTIDLFKLSEMADRADWEAFSAIPAVLLL